MSIPKQDSFLKCVLQSESHVASVVFYEVAVLIQAIFLNVRMEMVTVLSVIVSWFIVEI